ncbi:thioredoxin family protein [Haloferula sp. A504]|uniref:thioredoxin family protein n=1 Tax=Haloferula sp. A504 TaxID=3373601 RepID=UPI0031BCBE2B|nr:thioredoxin family protein [Verrucomicrobiaceae bacterium E54]
MKATLLGITTSTVLSIAPLLAGGEGWTSDFEAAKKQAAKEDKSLLIDFTGSDWCGWCIKLNEEVFQHAPFKEGVKDKFVLVELDYPRDKSKLSEKVQKQNEELKDKYGIRGFPTILLTDEEGAPFARTGYKQGGPEAYVTHLDELLEKRAVRDEALAKAKDLEGPEKAKVLVDALKAMSLEDEMIATFYGDLVEQIKAADPEDESGYVKGLEMKAKFAEFQKKLMSFGQKQDHEGALKLIEETLASGTFEGDTKQQVVFFKAMVLAQAEQFDEAVQAIDEAKAVAPESDTAARMDRIRGQLIQARDQAAAADEAPDDKDAEDSTESQP